MFGKMLCNFIQIIFIIHILIVIDEFEIDHVTGKMAELEKPRLFRKKFLGF